MKIALTADWHFRGKDLKGHLAQLNAMIAEAKARGCHHVLVAGDIFDRENVADSTANVAAIAGAVADAISSSDLHWLIIPGNHDFNGPSRVPATDLLRHLPRVEVVNEPMAYDAGTGTDTVAICLPWEYSDRNPEQVVASILADNRRRFGNHHKAILLGHVRVIGGRMSGTRTHERHGGWEVSREFLEQLDVDHIALGDFHGRQDLSEGKGGYIGALCQNNHGERGNQAGFEIYDLHDNKAEWVELDAAPRYETIEAFTDEDLVYAEWDQNSCVRIVCRGFQPDRTVVARLEAAGADVVREIPAIERIGREVELPEGILNDASRLIGVYASTLSPPIDADRLARLQALYRDSLEPFAGSAALPAMEAVNA